LAGLPLTPPEESHLDRSHPSPWRVDQRDREGTLAPVTPLDSIFPT
jgi:hypothetical protein